MSKLWHGMTTKQWLEHLDAGGWATRVTNALREIAANWQAAAHDRLLAMNLLNAAIDVGSLPPDPDFPRLMRDTMLEITERGESRFGKRTKAIIHERVLGIQWLLKTHGQFLPEEQPDQGHPPDVDYSKMS